MKIKFILLAMANACLLFSCNKAPNADKNSYDFAGNAMSISEPVAVADVAVQEEVLSKVRPLPPKTGIETNAIEKKIIKDGTLTLQSQDIQESKKKLDELLPKMQAYYEREELQNSNERTSYNLSIRIPASNFEKFLSNLESGPDELKEKNIQARDVTKEFIDTETRLQNKRAYLLQYKTLLQKASSVKDILAIEENIRVLQEEIESTAGQLQYLSNQVSYSTLNVTLYQEKDFVYQVPVQDKFGERVKKSIHQGWTSLVDLVLWVIEVWPKILLLLALYFIAKRYLKNRKQKQSQ